MDQRKTKTRQKLEDIILKENKGDMSNYKM